MPAPRVRNLVSLLEREAGTYRWVAATVNSNSAAGYQLATDDPVMAIGGFNGTDPAPTLAQFETYVRHGDIHYFIAGAGGGFGGGFGAGPGRGAAARRRRPARSPPGSRATTRPAPWTVSTLYDLTADGVH